MRSFASDNNAGIHPEILAAIAAANVDHAVGYGDDPWTARARERLRAHFGPDLAAFFVYTGTGANVLALRAVLRPYEAVLCAETAHLQTDECGTPEAHLGCKLLLAPSADGKVRPQDLAPLLSGRGHVQHVQPRAVSITQATELGTVYTPGEIRALADWAHAEGLLLHMDGARLANAAAHLELPLVALTRDAGVDLLSFGGTKNGMMLGESVIFFDPARAEGFPFLHKQAMQLGAKMRFLAAQFEAYLTDDLWQRNAAHANAMARALAGAAGSLPGVEILQPVQANAVFARLPAAAIPRLQERFFFYVWNETRCEVRWMTSFDTTRDDVDAFLAALRAALCG